MLILIEALIVLCCIIFASLWIKNPGGNYEPTIVLLTTILILIDLYRRYRKSPKAIRTNAPRQRDGIADQIEEIEENTKNSTVENGDKSIPPRSSTVFFYERFTSAFPGVRGIQCYEGKKAIERLAIFLAPQLVFDVKEFRLTPIWWWRGGNLPIKRFKILNRNTVLMGPEELKIKKLAAVNRGAYYHCFVYIETKPMKPTGLYKKRTKSDMEKILKNFGYDWEEYGLYKGKTKITRTEYDDNAALIKRKVVELNGDVELRVRYTTPYNFLVAAHMSPINNNQFDRELETKLNNILKGTETLENLSNRILELPRKYLDE